MSWPAVVWAQEPRRVAEILDDHARALGDARQVETLRAVAQVGDGVRLVKGARISWRKGTYMCEVPTAARQYPYREYFTPAGAFVSAGFFEAYRPNQQTTRAGYYFLKALAEPFPLLPYIGNGAAQKGLRVGTTTVNKRRHEVLFTGKDDHGVRAVYILDPDTHLLSNVRYEAKENEPLANVTYTRYKRVAGVSLAHAAYAQIAMLKQDPDERRLVPSPLVRVEEIAKWEVNPDLSGVSFEPPGLRRGEAEGFERSVFPTGPDPYELAVGDLDGDGRADIAVACEGSVHVHFGGDEKRPLAVPLGGGHMRGMVIEDFDLDGRPEVITTSNVNPAQIFFLISFGPKREPQVRKFGGAPLFASGLVAHDFDRDGIPDLAASGFASADLHIKFGDGGGGVRVVATHFPLTAKGEMRRGYGLAVGRITGSALDDIIVADGTRLVIFQGQTNLAYFPRFAFPARTDPQRPWRPVGVAVADLDRNGHDDLVIVREHPLEDLPGDVVVAHNDGDTLKAVATIDAGARVQSVAIGHFNGDVFPDAVVTSFLTGEVALLLNDGKGHLKVAARFASGRGAARIAVADYDGDGKDDIVAANRLADTVAVFRSRREATRPERVRPPRATACRGPTWADFRLVGLTDPYEFVGAYRIPAGILDPSGLGFLGGVANTQLVLVSDKASALFRVTLDRSRNRVLVGPPIPLRGLEGKRLDLEGVAFDRGSGNLFLGCEADSSIVRATVFGDVLGRAPTKIESGGNDGIEAVAVRRLKDGTPLLYVFKERNGTSGTQPVVHCYELKEDPFALEPRRLDLAVPVATPDQCGATVFDGKMFVVCRLFRGIAEVDFDGDGFVKVPAPRQASFAALTKQLGLESHPVFGNVEAIVFDQHGDLFLLLDNNRQTIGLDRQNRGPEGRLLWFRNRGEAKRRVTPRRVKVKHILVPWAGAQGAQGVERDRAAAQELARRLTVLARRGETLERIVSNEAGAGLKVEALTVVADAATRRAGEYTRADLPVALSQLVFNLDVGEVGLCEFHEKEAPFGWHVVSRVE
ncbi:MAG: FG-GAP-like repeat-containing protein [Planctomycetota bacterium]